MRKSNLSLNYNEFYNKDLEQNLELVKNDTIIQNNLNVAPNTSFLYIFFKRTFDLVASFIAILVLIVPSLILSLFIVLEGKGSPIFVHERIGKNGKPFKMYKFRSMYKDADNDKYTVIHLSDPNSPAFKLKEDPRITKIGKFIRKYSIDELPQLLNVFLGTMTFVGPRPPITEEVIHYSDFYRQRLLVKQGLTCYWQISGRSTMDFDTRMTLDVKYVSEQNLWVDFKILLKTLPAVLKGEGAW